MKWGESLTGKDIKDGFFVHGELWGAESEEVLEKDDKVTILEVNGMKLTVEKERV